VFTLCITIQGKKDCVFLHGSGQKEFLPPTRTFTDYWGDVHKYTVQCASTVFVHADTINNAFDAPKLMQTYADLTVAGPLALKHPMNVALSIAGPRIITNKIVFTHSLGNLVLAAAIKNGLVMFDDLSSTWYDIAGPATGSPAADFVALEICNNGGEDAAELRWLGNAFGLCNGKNVSAAYHSLRSAYPGLIGIPEIIRKYRDGCFCGTSAWGIFSKYSIPLKLVESIVEYNQTNDGLVTFASCADNSTGFSSNYLANYCMGKYNHADLTCRNGGDPCLWYANRL